MNAMKKELILAAQLYAEVCEAKQENLQQVVDMLLPELGVHMDVSEIRIYATAMVVWALGAFPSVEVGAKYAAALCLTDLKEETFDLVRSPWNSWMLEVPDGLLSLKNDGQAEVPIRRVLVAGIQGAWAWYAFTSTGHVFSRAGISTAQLRESLLEQEGDSPHHSTHNARLSSLIGRLIVGICLAMASPENIRKQPKTAAPKWTPKPHEAPDISARNYVIGKPIVLDFRDAVTDYLNGRKSSLQSVQCLVRGHWRMQAHGPKHSLRRVQWIEPFWRGPEGAPVMVRPHAIEGSSAELPRN